MKSVKQDLTKVEQNLSDIQDKVNSALQIGKKREVELGDSTLVIENGNVENRKGTEVLINELIGKGIMPRVVGKNKDIFLFEDLPLSFAQNACSQLKSAGMSARVEMGKVSHEE